MSKIYSIDSSEAKERRVALQIEYLKLSEGWKRFWSEDSKSITLIMQIQNDIKKIYREIRETENSQNLLSAEQRKILHDADLDTLKKLYRKCKREKVPYGDLVSAIEEEIYQKYFKENNIKVDRIYKLEKFVPNKKE